MHENERMELETPGDSLSTASMDAGSEEGLGGAIFRVSPGDLAGVPVCD